MAEPFQSISFFGEPGGSLWGSFGRQSPKMGRLCRCFGGSFSAYKKERNNYKKLTKN